MTRRQVGFLYGFLIGWLLWVAGFWVTLGAIALGLVGYGVVCVLEGDVDLEALTQRFRQ